MTRSYLLTPRARRITQPLPVIGRTRDASITDVRFTCFRLVPTSEGLVAIEMHHASNRMFAFVTA